MTKAIVETRGSFQLTGTRFDRADAVPFNRPAVVYRTPFIDAKIGAEIDGSLKLFGNVADEATDADWLEHLLECGWGTDEFDADFAFESYPHAQPDGAEPAAEAPKETAKERKAREAREAELQKLTDAATAARTAATEATQAAKAAPDDKELAEKAAEAVKAADDAEAALAEAQPQA